MKNYLSPGVALLVIILPRLIADECKAQSSDFDLDAYRQFLSAHQVVTSTQLREMYPAGLFQPDVPVNPPPVFYLDSIESNYQLTEHEKALIGEHGFMVTERQSANSFGEAFLDIWHRDLPVFISTDAILHALHMSYDRILTDVELDILTVKLDSLLKSLHGQLPHLAADYSSQQAMTQMLRDVDIYLTVPRILLGNSCSPFYPENASTIQTILDLIDNEQPADLPLFAGTSRTVDFSQFKVRGHYASPDYPKLAKYFKAMIWLGRTEFYLRAPQGVGGEPIPAEDIQRQIIDAGLILEATEHSGAFGLLEEIDSIIRFFVGESDNVTLRQYQELVSGIGVTSAAMFLDTLTVKEFQDTLRGTSFAFQKILSQILMADDCNPDSITPPSAFMLLGQRFIIDSYITGQVVYDRITYNGEKIRRMLPSTLDVLFALGNNPSAQLLEREVEQYQYGPDLAALRYLVDQYDTTFWESSLFNLWLNAIRALNPSVNRGTVPPFMETAAWWQEKMNTQLASWAELRHDNLLYGKQSYTGGIICSFPDAYVEPIPAFYERVGEFADIGRDKIESFPFTNEYVRIGMRRYFSYLSGTMDTLSSVATKELEMIPLSDGETGFLKRILFEQALCGAQYGGWYPKLFYGDFGSGERLLKKDFVAADIHTAPTDANGNSVGWVLHTGTGRVNLGVVVAPLTDGRTAAFAGPVMSYHEYLSTNFLRLSDEEWSASYLFNSTRPSFVNLYLADSLGNDLPGGTTLFTSAGEEPREELPRSVLLHQIYPNPFNSSAIIRYSIPEHLGNTYSELTIYTIEGQAVKSLLKANLPAGNFMTKWDGTDDRGIPLPSGVYFYRLSVGPERMTGKVTYIK